MTREPAVTSTLAESSVVATLHLTGDGRIAALNATLAGLLGLDEPGALRGRPVEDILASSDGRATLKPGTVEQPRRNVELRCTRADGKAVVLRGDVFTLQTPGQAPLVCGVFADHTELETLRRSMQHSARLEALASLVGGVAHDFNNLLTVLIGNLSLIAEEFRERPETFAKIKSSRDAATRGSDLIRQLLGFAHAEEVETSAIDPSEVIRKVVPLLGSALGKRVRLTTELDSGAGSVNANVALLESVIVNLAVNARDAISGHGTVTISSSRHTIDARKAETRGIDPGDYIRIRVADDGAGIPAELLQRVFEPFFTTKHDRGGTGLGLSMVRAFARQLGGRAAVRSEVGKGTVVSLWLPVCDDSTDTGSVQTASLAALPTGSEHIVCFSLDTGLAVTVSQMLEVLGYSITRCQDPAELAATASRETLPLLILDGVEPGTREYSALVDRVSRRHPELATIVMLEPGRAARSVSDGSARVLEKPFSLADLATLVRAALDR